MLGEYHGYMGTQIVRLIKAFCADFQPIRRTLTTFGATCVEQKEQVDYFFLLPTRTDAPACRRLKLRIENDQPRWIYYYVRNQEGSSLVNFQRSAFQVAGIAELRACLVELGLLYGLRR